MARVTHLAPPNGNKWALRRRPRPTDRPTVRHGGRTGGRAGGRADGRTQVSFGWPTCGARRCATRTPKYERCCAQTAAASCLELLFLLPPALLGPARLGSARLGSARPGSARLGPARLGPARLGSARPGPAHKSVTALLLLSSNKWVVSAASCLSPISFFACVGCVAAVQSSHVECIRAAQRQQPI